MSDELKCLKDEYRDVCAEMRVIQRQYGGEWTKEFKKLRRKANELSNHIERLIVSKPDTET